MKLPFDIKVMTPRGILGLCFVHIAKLMTHADPNVHNTVYLAVMLMPPGILQRVIKDEKVHISRSLNQRISFWLEHYTPEN